MQRPPRPKKIKKTKPQPVVRTLQAPIKIQRPQYQGGTPPGMTPGTPYRAPATRQKIRREGVLALRTGAHPQMWRTGRARSGGPVGAGARLGRTGTFESQTIILIQMNYDVLDIYQRELRRLSGTRQRLEEADLLRIVRRHLFNDLQGFAFTLIKKYVPTDTRRLANAMEISIRDQSATRSLNPFHVFLNTGNIEYARPVNRMPTAWLRHPGTHGRTLSYRKGRGRKRTPRVLFDPQAVSGWFYRVLNESRDFAAQVYRNLLSRYIGPLLTPLANYYGLPEYHVALSLFGVRFK